MKKLVFLMLLISMVACKISSEKAKEDSDIPLGQYEYVKYVYKVEGLEDSLKADSLWRLIFHIPGIDQIIVSKEDSIVSVVFEPDSISLKNLAGAIEKTGISIKESTFAGGK